MNLSYWEYKNWLSDIDFTIVGSGIVGLNCALHLRGRFPKSKILLLEKGFLPQGASTKNAGFACYGSISEILADLENHSEQEVLELVQKRWEGIQLLCKNLGKQTIGFKNWGGHELFLSNEKERYSACCKKISYVNKLLEPVFKAAAFKLHPNTFEFKDIEDYYISNHFEAQLDTGMMMDSFINRVHTSGIRILNGITMQAFEDLNHRVAVRTDQFEFLTKKLLLATNGFANRLTAIDVQPARAQVLITKPIENLKIKGTFHINEGYYYFRNIDNRILIGGGRNLDFKGEETDKFGCTEIIQNKLEDLLVKTIVPGQDFEVAYRWSGIMGVGPQKRPIVRKLSENVSLGVRLGGMGVAIGSYIGKELADLN